MKKRMISLLMALALTGCATGQGVTPNTGSEITSTSSMKTVQASFEEDPDLAVAQLSANTLEANQFQTSIETVYSGSSISPRAEVDMTGAVIDINITPENSNWTSTDYIWMDEGISYRYDDSDYSLSMDMDDGSMVRQYYMFANKAYDDPNNITISSINNPQFVDENGNEMEIEEITDPEIMQSNAKSTAARYLREIISHSFILNGDYQNPIEMEVTVQETEDGEDAIVLEPKDMDAFNEKYQEGNETYGSPLEVDGNGTKIDSFTYDLYQIIIVLNPGNTISQIIEHYKQTASYQDRTTSSDQMITHTVSRMEEDAVNKDVVKSVFTMYENGEIGEGDTFQINE